MHVDLTLTPDEVATLLIALERLRDWWLATAIRLETQRDPGAAHFRQEAAACDRLISRLI